MRARAKVACSSYGSQVHVLKASELHFVRCFKPNDLKESNACVDDVLSRQLYTSGVLDALRVARTGFPDRLAFTEFSSTFVVLATHSVRTDVESIAGQHAKEACAMLLQHLKVRSRDFRLGRGRIFLSVGLLEQLRTRRTHAMAAVTRRLQVHIVLLRALAAPRWRLIES